VTQFGFSLEPEEGDLAGQLASQALASIALDRQVERHRRSVQVQSTYPIAWRDVASQQQSLWWVTAEEMTGLRQELDALVQRHWDRVSDPSKRPDGAMPVEFISLTHIFDELRDDVGEPHD
jgi:hypothetical protein